uniref:Uncharacterized protein n=1 Tax=Oryza brachyantha TaxID=4533 RepID=J3MZK1_ORYBR
MSCAFQVINIHHRNSSLFHNFDVDVTWLGPYLVLFRVPFRQSIPRVQTNHILSFMLCNRM